MKGIIIKALSGFYYVAAEDRIITCRARGKFRKTGEVPCVGDRVEVSLTGAQGTVDRILPRKNVLLRPAISNLDALVLLISNVPPVTEPFLVDRVTAIACRQGIEPIICVSKCDLDPADRLSGIYQHAGFPVVRTSAVTGQGLDALKALLRGKTVCFTGSSGVGKSALLSALCPELALKTGEVSDKLGRGRHTTRHIELYPAGKDTYIADTPGFSSFDTERMELILKEELADAFPDFAPYLGKCRFLDCAHLKEPDCAVLAALARGEIEPTRHQSYAKLYEISSQIKLWEHKEPEKR